jgi:hypothetical protein
MGAYLTMIMAFYDANDEKALVNAKDLSCVSVLP